MNNNEKNYLQIPVNIFKDKRLKAQDIALLTSFFFLLKEEDKLLKLKQRVIMNRLGISKNQFELTLKRLIKLNWVKVIKRNEDEQVLEIAIKIPEINEDPYQQPGSKIARSWNKYFGNRMIKYEDVQELKRFVLDGMEEDLVLRIMEYSGLKAEGSPFHYAKAVLLDLYSRGILTVDAFEEEEGKGDLRNEQYISKDDRGEKTGISRKKFKEEEYR